MANGPRRGQEVGRMNRRFWHLEMALVVIVGVWSGPLAAQQAPPAPTPNPQPSGNAPVVQTYAVVPVVPHTSAPPYYVPPQAEPPNGPVRRLFYHVGSYSK